MHRSAYLATFALLLVAAWALAPPAFAQLITPAVLEGDPVAGVGNVTTVNNLAINGSGSWLVEADTDNADTNVDEVMLRDGALYLREGQLLVAPPGAGIGSFDSVNLNENGDSGWNFFLENTGGTTNDSGIFFNTALVIQESDISIAPEFSPGTPYIGFFDAKILPNNSSQILMVASIDDPIIPTTVDRAIVRVTHDGTGALVSEAVVMKEGDIPPGQIETIADFGTGPHQSAFNDAGNAMFFVDLNGSTTTDGVIYLNNTILAQEGSAAPEMGRNYELLSSRPLDLANSGAWVLRANLDGATTDDEVLVRNGAIFMREGQTLPGLNGYLLTSFGTGPVEISSAGNVLWYGDWDDPDTNIDTGLFLNDLLLVQEGVTTVNGIVIDTISGSQDGFALSDNGFWAIFEATLLDGTSGAFLIDFMGPVPVTLSGLAAIPGDREVILTWDTQVEVAHEGFHVYRSDTIDGVYERMTSTLVRSEGSHRWVDRRVESDHTYFYRIGAVGTDGREDLYGPVSVTTPRWFTIRTALMPPMPNPVVSRTELRFSVEREGAVDLSIYDVSGRLVHGLVREVMPAGEYSRVWDGRDASGHPLPAGVYFSKLTAGDVTQTQKIAILGSR